MSHALAACDILGAIAGLWVQALADNHILQALLDLLAVSADARSFSHVNGNELTSGTPLPAPQGVFPRYVEQDTAD